MSYGTLFERVVDKMSLGLSNGSHLYRGGVGQHVHPM